MNPFLALFAAAQQEVGATGPSDNPSGVTTYTYGGGLVGVQWTNEDTSASTRIGFSNTSLDSSPAPQATVSPGVSSYETGSTDSTYWYVQHVKNHQFSDWQQAGFPDD